MGSSFKFNGIQWCTQGHRMAAIPHLLRKIFTKFQMAQLQFQVIKCFAPAAQAHKSASQTDHNEWPTHERDWGLKMARASFKPRAQLQFAPNPQQPVRTNYPRPSP
ncbi:unnamed protein product [Prunus armeniaca]